MPSCIRPSPCRLSGPCSTTSPSTWALSRRPTCHPCPTCASTTNLPPSTCPWSTTCPCTLAPSLGIASDAWAPPLQGAPPSAWQRRLDADAPSHPDPGRWLRWACQVGVVDFALGRVGRVSSWEGPALLQERPAGGGALWVPMRIGLALAGQRSGQ